MGSKGKSKYDGVFATGQLVGEWTIVTPTIVVDKEAKVKCACSCGRERYVSCYTLIKGTSKSCKICQNENSSGSDNNNWKGVGAIPLSYFRTATTDDDRIALSETWDDSNGKCAMTGWDISISDRTASPDRIDSSKGYTKDNIQWVHKNVNIAKNMFDNDYFLTICHSIVSNIKTNPMVYETTTAFGTKIRKNHVKSTSTI